NTNTTATKSGTGYTIAAINADYKTTTSANNTDFTYNSNGDVSKAGVYYNYCAASAGTICDAAGSNNNNAQYDICPKGWRLPTGGSDANTSEFRALANNLGNVTSGNLTGDAYTDFKAAFHAGLSGYFDNGSVRSQTSDVIFWSSTRYDGSNIYPLFLNTTTVYPQGSNYRYYGLSVRCILKSAAERELESGMTMQSLASMSSEEKATFIASIPTNATYQMTDVRDGTVYNVGKLNGKIWMLDNLALGGSSTMTLDSTNTNLADNATYILPASGTQCFTNQNTTCTGTDGTTTGNGYTVAAINADYKTTTSANGNNFTYNSNGDVSKAGVYYNYCAASAGTYCYAYNSAPAGTNAQYDICPKGWRLPTGGDSGEFRALANNLGNVTTGNLTKTAYTDFKAAFHAGLSGGVYNDSVQYQASSVYFWSSTRLNGYNMYILYLDTSTVYPQNYSSRYLGYSVRCVYGS
ncbi:hypothetical protein IKE83_00435, partial [Candidatus Saccharibacteria bacterium]|nr:hypothetical protein [Candidatus Saccharibacteria bacterium]